MAQSRMQLSELCKHQMTEVGTCMRRAMYVPLSSHGLVYPKLPVGLLHPQALKRSHRYWQDIYPELQSGSIASNKVASLGHGTSTVVGLSNVSASHVIRCMTHT